MVGLWSMEALGGLLVGVTASGVLLALFMANAGGAWDNAKKHIEAGNHGGKGSDAHKATVVGDTVGDPFKDTAGPSLNILIKLMSIVAVVTAPALYALHGGSEQPKAASADTAAVVQVLPADPGAQDAVQPKAPRAAADAPEAAPLVSTAASPDVAARAEAAPGLSHAHPPAAGP